MSSRKTIALFPTFFAGAVLASFAFCDDTLNDHLSTAPREMNFRLNAVNLEVSTATVEADFKCSHRLTLGPVLGFTSTSSDQTGTIQTGFIAGGRANIYLSGEAMADGWYLSPQAGYSLTFLTSNGLSGKSSALYVAVSGGYHWIWENGFNAMVGAGTTYYSASKNTPVSHGNGTLQAPGLHGLTPFFDVSLGMAL